MTKPRLITVFMQCCLDKKKILMVDGSIASSEAGFIRAGMRREIMDLLS